MINIVIIEDEAPARRKLLRFIDDLNTPATVIAELTTVSEAITFLRTAKNIDLILSDIELLDGNAFSIYNEVPICTPIIFTTAYNQYLMEAFESNGIEYLLKPFSFERFKKAWDKFLMLRNSTSIDNELFGRISRFVDQQCAVSKVFKKRFAVSTSKGTYFIDADDILFFAAEDGAIFALDSKGKRHLLTCQTLKEIENLLDPDKFFRINRSEVVNKQHVERIERYTKNTIAIKFAAFDKCLVTSQNSTAQFREWLES